MKIGENGLQWSMHVVAMLYVQRDLSIIFIVIIVILLFLLLSLHVRLKLKVGFHKGIMEIMPRNTSKECSKEETISPLSSISRESRLCNEDGSGHFLS